MNDLLRWYPFAFVRKTCLVFESRRRLATNLAHIPEYLKKITAPNSIRRKVWITSTTDSAAEEVDKLLRMISKATPKSWAKRNLGIESRRHGKAFTTCLIRANATMNWDQDHRARSLKSVNISNSLWDTVLVAAISMLPSFSSFELSPNCLRITGRSYPYQRPAILYPPWAQRQPSRHQVVQTLPSHPIR